MSVRLSSRPKVRVSGHYPVADKTIEVTSVELAPSLPISTDDVSRCGQVDREALRNRAAHAGPVANDTPVYRIEFRVASGPAHSRAYKVICASLTSRARNAYRRLGARSNAA